MGRVSKKSKGVKPSLDGHEVFGIKADGSDVNFPMQAFVNLLAGLEPSPDTTPPTIPLNFRVVVNRLEATLSWNASTDDRSTPTYILEHTLATDTDWTSPTQVTEASTTRVLTLVNGDHKFRVKAVDASGNESGYSAEVAATIFVDQEAPTVPQNLAIVINDNALAITWDASTDNVGVDHYDLAYTLQTDTDWSDEIIINRPTNSHNITLADAQYMFRVRAVDAEGNQSAYSSVANATVADTEAPTVPSNLTISSVNSYIVSLSWDASTDNRPGHSYLLEYTLQSDGEWGSATVIPVTATNKNVTVPSNEDYKFRVRAVDTSTNYSAYSNIVTRTIFVDTTPPTVPGTLSASENLGVITLNWGASTDDSGSVSYQLFYSIVTDTNWTNATRIDTSEITRDLTLPSNGYKFRVRAIDPTGNTSAYSNIALIKIGDTEPPTIPQEFGALVSVNSATLIWNASTDNVAVENYQIQYTLTTDTSWASPTTLTETTTSREILLRGGEYKARVRAKDTSDNYSGWSDEIVLSLITGIGDDDMVYYGQYAPDVVLNTDFFEQLNDDADNYINTPSFTLQGQEVTSNTTIQIPYLGSPFEHQSEIEKIGHFLAVPDGITVVSSVNAAFPSDVFFDGSNNEYIFTKIQINGHLYSLWIYRNKNPLGGYVAVTLQV